MNSLVIGLVGCGIWGRNILRELTNLGAQTYVIDPGSEARDFANQNGAHSTYSEVEGAPTVDGFILSTPASMHAKQIEALMAYGKPIFTEKPFVLDLNDALRLQELGHDQVFVMHVWRYHPAVQKLKEMIHSHQLGELELIRTRRCNWTSPRKDVDPIWTLLPHDISIFTELTGNVPSARFATPEMCESKAVGMLAHTDAGCPCIAEVSTRYKEKVREIRVHGSKGVVVMPKDGTTLFLYEGSHNSPTPNPEEIHVETDSALQLEIAAFLNYLNGGPPPRTSLGSWEETTPPSITTGLSLRSLDLAGSARLRRRS